MSDNGFWKINKLEENQLITPKDVIQNQFDILREITNGEIIGRIKEYEGEYKDTYSYGTPFGEASAFTMSVPIQEPIKTFDVQSVLGDSGNFVYEFYITSKATSKYRYKIGIIYYDIFLYPVHIILEKSLADELQLKTEIEASNEDKFIEYISKIFSSERVTCVIKNLISMNAASS